MSAPEPGPQPEVSVIIPTTGGAPFLAEQLAAVAAQRGAPAFEVLLVANRSTRDLDADVAAWASQLSIKLVRADDRAGQSFARNAGIGVSTAPKLLFTDHDDVVSETYVAVMAAALDISPAVAARMDLALLNPGWRADVREIAQVEGLATSPVRFAYGTSLGACREVIDRIGMFDERFDGLGGEDVDWCRRLAAEECELAFVPEAVVHYPLPTRYQDLLRQGYRYGRAGQIASPEWPGWSVWFRSLFGPIRLLLLTSGKGSRRRGAFLLGRRFGWANERHQARIAPAPGHDG